MRPPAALGLLLRADAEPWTWSTSTLPALATRLGAPPPVPLDDGQALRLPVGSTLLAVPDRDDRTERLTLAAQTPFGPLTRQVAASLGRYLTARRGDTVRRWWPLPSGRRIEASTAASDDALGTTLDLVRAGVPAPGWVPPEALVDAAADCAVRIADAGYVPAEDESLPDMAAALGGRLAWSSRTTPRRQISLPGPPFHVELVRPVVAESGLTWYSEIRFDLYGSGDVPGSSRRASYGLLVTALARRCGEQSMTGPEASYWRRENGWTVAADRSSGVVRLRLRPPGEAPIRPPD